MIGDRRKRVVITNVSGELEGGRCSIKRCLNDEVVIEADIFTDGHADCAALLLYKKNGATTLVPWEKVPMQLIDNDRFRAAFTVDSLGTYLFKLHAWVDHFATWKKDLQYIKYGIDLIKRALAHRENSALRKYYDLLTTTTDVETARTIACDPALSDLMRQHAPNRRFVTEYHKTLSIVVEPVLARCSAWYELFPRSCSQTPGVHGTFEDCIKRLPLIAKMGFDIVYLPPIHPIGTSFRKGKNNQLIATESDPGSPWAIGNGQGGHKSIHPLLGSEHEFEALVSAAQTHGMQIGMDIAFQCSPDHPYLREHPEWFYHLPDGTIKHAENPPKKYEDIVPFNFDTSDCFSLWHELLGIVQYWISKGVRCFRVDNPHTKPFSFWQWLIAAVKRDFPEVIFLAEAFTRPKVMHWLAKIGFSQSYTYFTWRYTKDELIRYVTEITKKQVTEYFRPNFWPNTPDILPFDLQYYGEPAFKARLLLAATLSSNYGVYGPAFEHMVNKAIDNSEEYFDAEKYEIKFWDSAMGSPITELMIKINAIRRENPALQQTDNIQFHETNNASVIAFSKSGPDLIVVVVSLDPYNTQSVTVNIPYKCSESYRVHELLEERRYIWQDSSIQVTIDPHTCPGRIFKICSPLMREKAFDYFM